MKSVYKKLVSFQDAVRLAFGNVEPVEGRESIDIRDSAGRILARNVYAPRDNPPFNRSTMDGFAVRSGDVQSASPESPTALELTGESFIGEPGKRLSGEGSCFRISTGAIVPAGADAVVKVENTEIDGNRVSIMEPVGSSENIAASGSDISGSELLLLSGKAIETNDIAVLASLGIHRVEVYRKLRVAVISTGNELISYSTEYSEGRINDANGVVVTSEINSFPTMEATYLGILRDDYATIKDAMESAVREHDVVILSGGSSAGESDLVYRIIEEMSPGLVFHGVLVKPGLPTVLGRSGKKCVIGLPGFPVSALMIFRSIFLNPLIGSSRSDMQPARRKAVLGTRLKLEMGKQNLIPIRTTGREGSRIYPVTGLSGSISRFTATSGFISVPGDTKYLEAGDEVDVILWASSSREARRMIGGTVINRFGQAFPEGLSDTGFSRMLPRESLKALENRDLDLAAMWVAPDAVSSGGLVSGSLGEELEVIAGHETELVLASRLELESVNDVLTRVEAGEILCGPAYRFLSGIFGSSGILAGLCTFINSHLSSYTSTGSDDPAGVLEKTEAIAIICSRNQAERAGLHYVPVSAISPVYVYRRSDSDLLMDILDGLGK